MKTPAVAALSLVWISTLAGAWWMGHRSEVSEEARKLFLATQSESGNAGGDAKSKNGKAGNGDAAGMKKLEGVKGPLTLKQILAQLKSSMRSGGMNNPATAIKMISLLGQIRDEDIPAALAEAADIKDPGAKTMLYMTLLTRMAEKDGPGALKYADEHLKDQGPLVKMSRMGILSAWAEHDPEAAWKYYKDTSEEGDGGMFGGRKMMLSGLFSTMAAQDQNAAFQRLSQLEEKDERSVALMGIAQSASGDDESMKRLLSHISSLPDADERNDVRNNLLSQMAMSDPEKAQGLIKDLPADEKFTAVDRIGNSMLMNDPKKGAAYLLENGDPQKKSQTYEKVVGSWARNDPNAAGNWLNDQPAGPELDSAKSSFANIVTDRDPTSAMEWAKSISAEEQRGNAVEQVYNKWAKKDAPAAGAALDQSGLPAQKVISIRESFTTKKK